MMLQYFTAMVNECGTNDETVNSTDAHTLAAARTTLAGYFNGRGPVIGTTVYTRTTSTDSWATTANQTIASVYQAGGVALAFNGLVRAGIAGETNYWDISDALDPYRTSYWPVSRIPGATTGTAYFSTTDGIHTNAAGAEQIKRSGLIKLDYLKGPMAH